MGTEESNPSNNPIDPERQEALQGLHNALERLYIGIEAGNTTPVLDQAPDFRDRAPKATSSEGPVVPSTRLDEAQLEINRLYDQYRESKDPELLRQIKKLNEEIFWRREENIPGRPVNKY